MYLISDVIDQSRYLLQDRREPYRHSDDELLAYFNNAVAEAYRIRPDLFLGLNYTLTAYTSANLTDDFPLAPFYAPQFIVYIAGFADLSNDEYATDGRAVALLNKFTAGLLSTS
jgi:hypothetical protein